MIRWPRENITDIFEEGDVAVNAKVFSEIIRKLPENDVTIQTNDKQQIIIICEKAKLPCF